MAAAAAAAVAGGEEQLDMEAFFRQVSSQAGQMRGSLTAAHCTCNMHQAGVLTYMPCT